MDRMNADTTTIAKWWGHIFDPLPEYLIDRIRPEDMFRLEQFKMQAIRQHLEIEQKLVANTMEVLQQYGELRTKATK